MVTRRFQLVGVALACSFVWAVIAQKHAPPPHPETDAISLTAIDASPVDHEALQKAHDLEAEARIRELTRLETAKHQRDLAASKMTSARKLVQSAFAAPWAAVLTSNGPAFLKLRQLALHSPTHETPCTICEGSARLRYCVVCSGLKGRCATCQGSGLVVKDEICPACLGSRNCFVCFGTGEMPCPFCIEGVVDSKQPLPPNQIPIN